MEVWLYVLLFYIASVVENFSALLGVIGMIAIIVHFVLWMVREGGRELAGKWLVVTGFIALLSITTASLIPSKEVIYVAMGAKAVIDIKESEVGEKVQAIVMKELDEYLAETGTDGTTKK